MRHSKIFATATLLSATIFACWTEMAAQQQDYPTTGHSGFTDNSDWPTSAPERLDETLGEDADMSPDHWGEVDSDELMPDENWDGSIENHPWLQKEEAAEEFPLAEISVDDEPVSRGQNIESQSIRSLLSDDSRIPVVTINSDDDSKAGIPLPPSAKANRNTASDSTPSAYPNALNALNAKGEPESSREYNEQPIRRRLPEPRPQDTPPKSKITSPKNVPAPPNTSRPKNLISKPSQGMQAIEKETVAPEHWQDSEKPEAHYVQEPVKGYVDHGFVNDGYVYDDYGRRPSLFERLFSVRHRWNSRERMNIRDRMASRPSAQHWRSHDREMFDGPLAALTGSRAQFTQDNFHGATGMGVGHSQVVNDFNDQYYDDQVYAVDQGFGRWNGFFNRNRRDGRMGGWFGPRRNNGAYPQANYEQSQYGFTPSARERMKAEYAHEKAQERREIDPLLRRSDSRGERAAIAAQRYPAQRSMKGYPPQQEPTPVSPTQNASFSQGSQNRNGPMNQGADNPVFNPELGHRDANPTVRGKSRTPDNGQKYGFEKKEYPPMREILRTGRYFASTDQMLLKPHFQGNNSIATSDGNISAFDFDHALAPQITFGFESKYGPGIKLKYFQYDQTSDFTSFTSDGAITGTTSAWAAGPSQWSRITAGNAGDTLVTNHGLETHLYEASFFKDIKFPISRLSGSFGLQYARIDQQLNASVTDAGGTETDRLSVSTDMDAIGPKVAFDYFRPIGHTKMELVSTFGGSMLFGNRDQRVSNTSGTSSNRIGADEFIMIFEIGSGVQSHRYIGENRSVFWKAGWFSQTWINGGSATDPSDDFGFRGFTLSVGFNR